VLPKPAHDIPIWVGGSNARARRRGIERGDGFHLIGLDPEEVAAPIEELRAARPEAEFRISLRTGWDPQGMETERIRREREEYEAAGIDYIVAAPWQTDPDSWLRSMEQLADLVGLTPRPG
jgi:alkanesulfonate monooxygenase SsuD/methylene tetrahydromethanopterin reductase-like flavin-dependent oxidoreductase (luciferase family)